MNPNGKALKTLEARVGIEPTNKGFADLDRETASPVTSAPTNSQPAILPEPCPNGVQGKCLVKRLSLQELEEWKAKAKALDDTVEWMTGRLDSEKLIKGYAILTRKEAA